MKVCLVTGGSRGIGRAISERMAREGYAVVVNFMANEAAAEETCAAIRSAGGEAWSFRADVTNGDDVRALFKEIESRAGRLDLLVNNAGQARDGLFALTKPDVFLEQICNSLRGPILCSQAAIRLMLKQKSGSIVNISSAAAYRGPVGSGAYAASKAALNSLTQTIAREVASYGIRVNAVAPSWVETEMIEAKRERIAEQLKLIPLKRIARTDEVAAAVAAIARDDMSYYTGQVLVLAGGA